MTNETGKVGLTNYEDLKKQSIYLELYPPHTGEQLKIFEVEQ